jgi:hypothetical protein
MTEWHAQVAGMTVRRVSLLLLALLAVLPSAKSQDIGAIGIVSEVRGSWIRTKDSSVLKFGDEIFPDTRVRTARSTSSRITIALFDQNVWVHECSVAAPCDGSSYAVPNIPIPPSGALAFLRGFFAAKAKLPIIFTAARGLDGDGPHEAVMSIEGDSVSLADALSAVPPGRIRVILANPARQDIVPASGTIAWPKDARLSLNSQGSQVLSLEVQTEVGGRIGSLVPVLVVAQKHAGTAQQEFAQAVRLAGSWKGVDAVTVHRFLAQALYAILEGLDQ